jgi:starch synthase (maltosyl-transferring)
MERVAHHGEEYLDSEKYQLRSWDLERPDSLRHWLGRLNAIRRANPALQANRNLHFHRADDPFLLAFSKATDDRENEILVLANFDFAHRHAGWIELDLAALGLGENDSFQVEDLLGTGGRWTWRGRRAYVDLDPNIEPVRILRVRRLLRRESDFEYYA